MFQDRADAGAKLLAELPSLDPARTVVIALPRGGVPVAEVIADALGIPLDVALVRKVGVPGHEELALDDMVFWRQSFANLYGGCAAWSVFCFITQKTRSDPPSVARRSTRSLPKPDLHGASGKRRDRMAVCSTGPGGPKKAHRESDAVWQMS